MSGNKSGILFKLSQLNRRLRESRTGYRLRYSRMVRRESGKVEAAAQLEGAVPWSEVREMFKLYAPFDTGLPLIRIGPDFDGGYLLPDDLDGIRAVFSPGVDETLGFDLEMSARCAQCYLADASVEEPRGLKPNMTFIKKFIGGADDPMFITLEDWVNRNEPGTEDLLLQMDIEGAEFDVLASTPDEVMSRFRIILLEVHDFDLTFDRAHFEKFRAMAERLNETHVLCHMHSNNSKIYYSYEGVAVAPVFEVSYIRKDRIKHDLKPAIIPHPLDQPNNPVFPDTVVPRIWQV